jgi:hypothetical protein
MPIERNGREVAIPQQRMRMETYVRESVTKKWTQIETSTRELIAMWRGGG